jgi:hypothetical protein
MSLEQHSYRHAIAFSRHVAPELLKATTLEKAEGAGNAGCALHPRPPVQQKSTGVSNQGYTATTGIPCTMVLTVSFVLFPVTMLGCHRHQRDASASYANLAPASERQNHTTSPYAASIIRPRNNCA